MRHLVPYGGLGKGDIQSPADWPTPRRPSSQVSNPASSWNNNASKKMPLHSSPATNQNKQSEKVETFPLGFPPAFLRRIKYFSSFSLHPNQQQQQQPSRRRKPKSIDAMVLHPSISLENYSVRLHCMGLGMRKTSSQRLPHPLPANNSVRITVR